jgi:hypothetical protein
MAASTMHPESNQKSWSTTGHGSTCSRALSSLAPIATIFKHALPVSHILHASFFSHLDALCHHTDISAYKYRCSLADGEEREREFHTCSAYLMTSGGQEEEPPMTAQCRMWVVWLIRPNWSENSSRIRKRRQRQDMMSWEGVPLAVFHILVL